MSKTIGSAGKNSHSSELHRILGLSVPVSAALAERDMSVESIVGIAIGSIVEFDVSVERDLTLYVGNHPVGRGQAVKTGEQFGIRVSAIDPVASRIGAMSGSATQS